MQGDQKNEMLQLIPLKKLWDDLPRMLVDRHVHWLNLSTKVIEIRPLERLWEESSENWRIDCASGQYRMYRGNETLLDINSPICAMVSKCFDRLINFHMPSRITSRERIYRRAFQLRNILITTSSVGSQAVQSSSVPRLSVTLPGYGLSFFVNDREELESLNFKGMVYDEDQSVGAFFGLENLLVLRPRTYTAETLIPKTLIPRCVIIPNGEPKKCGDHRVWIDMQEVVYWSHQPLFHTYDVDVERGCLIGNDSFESARHLIGLHALTNSHRPDPLTGKTGAEAALCLLRSAKCRSLMKRHTLSDLGDCLTDPQVHAGYAEIQTRYLWDGHASRIFSISPAQKCAMQRAAYLLPFQVIPTVTTSEPNSPVDRSYIESDHSTTEVSARLRLPIHLHPPTLDQLLLKQPAPELSARSSLLRNSHDTSRDSDDVSALDQLFSSFQMRTSFHREYVANLAASMQSVHPESQVTYELAGDNRIETLKKHFVQCRLNYMDSLSILQKSLGPATDPQEPRLERFSRWTPITADVLLRYLASTSQINISPCWKKCLTSLALLLLDLQRSRRLLRFALDGLEEDFLKELENEVCDGWDPEEHPDWLLIQVAPFCPDACSYSCLCQIQGNFLIRRTQAETAKEIISPQSGRNTVMQVNMGDGKSSVIIPIAAAALADGKQLVRVIVPKALTVQMFELLVSRLGGLTNRPVYHLSFPRTPEDDDKFPVIRPPIDRLQRLMSQCMTEHGILLLRPEHVVSLKLMSIENQICRDLFMGHSLLRHAETLYKRIKAALSLRSVSIVSVYIDYPWLSCFV